MDKSNLTNSYIKYNYLVRSVNSNKNNNKCFIVRL